jgi:hypothetical protein
MDAKQVMRLCERASLQDPAKRQRLMQLLCAGALGLAPQPPLQAAWFGGSPKKLDDDRSIYKLEGEVLVNGRRANKNTRIYAGDTVRRGRRRLLHTAQRKRARNRRRQFFYHQP